MTNKTLRSLRAVMYAALDDTLFADIGARPALTAAYTASFQSYRTALQAAPALDLCAACDAPTAVTDLKPLDSDDVYTAYTKVWSLNRDDGVCPDCRAAIDAEFQTDDTDVYHVLDRGHDRRD